MRILLHRLKLGRQVRFQGSNKKVVLPRSRIFNLTISTSSISSSNNRRHLMFSSQDLVQWRLKLVLMTALKTTKVASKRRHQGVDVFTRDQMTRCYANKSFQTQVLFQEAPSANQLLHFPHKLHSLQKRLYVWIKSASLGILVRWKSPSISISQAKKNLRQKNTLAGSLHSMRKYQSMIKKIWVKKGTNISNIVALM